MKRLLAVIAFFATFVATQAGAASLSLGYSGVFSADSTLGGVAFGADTPFTFQATFDSTTDTDPGDGIGLFDAVVTFSIQGFGSFTTDPAGDVNVVLADITSGLPAYAAGLVTADQSWGFFRLFFAVTPAIDADVPGPSRFSGIVTTAVGVPFVIPLSLGRGDLVINDFVSLGETAEITLTTTTPVPEPGAVLLFASGAVALLARMRPTLYSLLLARRR